MNWLRGHEQGMDLTDFVDPYLDPETGLLRNIPKSRHGTRSSVIGSRLEATIAGISAEIIPEPTTKTQVAMVKSGGGRGLCVASEITVDTTTPMVAPKIASRAVWVSTRATISGREAPRALLLPKSFLRSNTNP